MSIHNINSVQYECSLHYVFRRLNVKRFVTLHRGKLVVVWQYS